MNAPITPPELIEKIQGADYRIPDSQVAKDLGVHRNTVRKYRKQVREERQEIAREVVARHVEANIPDALADLTELRRLAKAAYEVDADPRQGSLWLGAIKTTLEHVKPDDAALDAAIEAELAALGAGGQEAIALARSGSASAIPAYSPN